MAEKEGDSPLIISNFEINKPKNKVVIYINKRIFPVSSVKEAAFLFKDKSWVALEENENEILVELKPKSEIDLELLAREFNNELLAQSTKEIKKVDAKSDDFVSRIKEVVSEFISEEQGRISKQSILTIGAILTTLGLAGAASASHLCPPPGEGAGDGGGGTSGEGGPCCFIAGTKIQMADGSAKNIEKVKIGNVVKSYNSKTGRIEDKKVSKIDTPIHEDMIVIKFGNGKSNTNTQDHPYYVKGKGWCSYKPKLTKARYKLQAKQLRKGDVVYSYDRGKLKEIKLIKITEKPGRVQTYNLGRVEDNHTYFANGILVHNKDGEGGEGGCCFEPHQSVLTIHGPLEIKNVSTGSKVVSYDEEKDKFSTSTVDRIIIHDGKLYNMNNFTKHPLIKIYVDVDGKLFETKVTDNHTYFDIINNKFRPLSDLKVGDNIKTIDGEGIIVSKEVLIDANSPPEMQKEVVYNLHMKEGPHSYIVNGAVVHNGKCFPAGTKILMADWSSKNIEEIKTGDIILTFDTEFGISKPSKVLEIESKIREGLYKINKEMLMMTDDHPIYVRKNNEEISWAAVNPENAERSYSISGISKLSIGDEVYTFNRKWEKITSLEYIEGTVRTFTIKDIEGGGTFFANGILALKSDLKSFENLLKTKEIEHVKKINANLAKA